MKISERIYGINFIDTFDIYNQGHHFVLLIFR